MPKAVTPGRTNITLTMTEELGKKVDRAVALANATKNALLLGVIYSLTEEELATAYRKAYLAGQVRTRLSLSEDRKAIMAKLSTLSEDKINQLLAQLDQA